MTLSTLKFEFALAIVLAAASASAIAQEKPGVTIEVGKVQETTAGHSYIDIKESAVERTVNFANLDLATDSGAAELRKRVMDAAKGTCEQADGVHPGNLLSTSELSCIRRMTESGLEQANGAIATAEFHSAMRATQVASK
jgi:UrcA family protein